MPAEEAMKVEEKAHTPEKIDIQPAGKECDNSRGITFLEAFFLRVRFQSFMAKAFHLEAPKTPPKEGL